MSKSLKIIIPVLLVLGIGFGVYYLIDQRRSEELSSAVEAEREQWRDKTAALEERITRLQDELTEGTDIAASQEKVIQALGKDAALPPSQQEMQSFSQIEQQVLAFFEYLDSREYIADLQFETGMQAVFHRSVRDLSQRLPVVSRETRDIVTLTRNLAHFYRVLGLKRIKLTKAVLANESDIMESIMSSFYYWFVMCPDQLKTSAGCASREVLYEYAGFFLSTLGGKSYLMRRTPKIRLLVSYYAVLLVDMANRHNINRNGIDVQPYIHMLMQEFASQTGLVHQDAYLSRLRELQTTYAAR